jgi:ATP-dependent Clp protease adapter protein ClpS
MPVAEPIQIVSVDNETKKKFHPNYRVILHNDDGVAMQHVVLTLNEVMGYNETKATSIMLQAHTTGKGEVIVCSSEEYAEAYSDQLNTHQTPFGGSLTTTVEPMEVG